MSVMSEVEWSQRRVLQIALMAATLEAGDRASGQDGSLSYSRNYVERARELFAETERQTRRPK